MTRYAAFLRGVNLGKRQVKSADLLAAFTAMGFANVKTLLASGNVLFDADPPAADQTTIERALQQHFGFAVGTVLRTRDELRALIALDPFAGRAEDGNTKLYVTFLADPVAKTLPMPCVARNDFEVVLLTEREVCMLASRNAEGRYGLGMEQVWEYFGTRLWTSRNWNTVLKASQ